MAPRGAARAVGLGDAGIPDPLLFVYFFDAGVGGAQAREEAVADAIPRNAEIVVRGVVDRLEAELDQRGEELGARDVEERTPDGAAPGRDAFQTLDGSTAQELQDDRFELVVALMRGQDPRRAELDPERFERSVAQPARGGLGALAALAQTRQVDGDHADRSSEPRREPLRPLGAVGRAGVEAMVDMSERQLETALRGGRRERGGERGRVGAPGVGDEPTLALRQILVGEEAAQAANESGE